MRIDYEKMNLAAMNNNDNNMCTVIALACCKNWTYEGAYKYAQKHGRKHGCGMIVSKIERMLGIKWEDWKWTQELYGRRLTPNTFAKMHPKGKYYCLTRSHAIAIVDGVVQDWTEGRRYQIQRFIEVK